MEEVLEYLYTGHVDINEHNAFDLLAAADFFLIPSLKSLCCKVILQVLSFSNCITAYYLAGKYRCEKLLKHARDFILANFVAAADTEDFLNLSSKQVEEWISSDEIVVKGEEEVFEILMKWIKRNESQKQSFYDLFRHIRCIYVQRDFFLKVILPDPFVKNNLDNAQFALDAMKMVFSGQEECYFAQSPRNCLKTHEDAIVACGTNKTLCYIPYQNKWYELADKASVGFYCSQNISTCHGKLFRIGGNYIGYPAERYDPSVNMWFPLKSFQQRIMFCTAVTFQGLLYVIGGTDGNDNRLSTVQRYNPETNIWQVMPSLSSSRVSVCAVADENHLYAIGGRSAIDEHVNIVERFDPSEKAWSRLASTIEKRRGPGGAAVNHKIFVFGGVSDEAPDSSACEMYDPDTNTWSVIACMVSLRGFASAVSFKGKIFVFGEFKEGNSGQGNLLLLQVYDPLTNEWNSCTSCSLGPGKSAISTLRIPKEILDTRKGLELS